MVTYEEAATDGFGAGLSPTTTYTYSDDA